MMATYRTHDGDDGFVASRMIGRRFEPKRFRSRWGFMLIEMMIAGLLLGTVIAVAIPTVKWVGHERRAAQRRQTAIIEVANIMETLASQPWNAIVEEEIGKIKISDRTREQLPNADLRVTLESSEDEKRIDIHLQWNDENRQPVAPVRLTGWNFRQGVAE